MTRGPKSDFICDNIPTKAILFFFGCLEVHSTWLIISELANLGVNSIMPNWNDYYHMGMVITSFYSFPEFLQKQRDARQ